MQYQVNVQQSIPAKKKRKISATRQGSGKPESKKKIKMGEGLKQAKKKKRMSFLS